MMKLSTHPESVSALRAPLKRTRWCDHDSPEYNHGMSGVLKNALDSGPLGPRASVLKSKPALTMRHSPAFTGRVARRHTEDEEARYRIHEYGHVCFSAQIVIGGVDYEKAARRGASSTSCAQHRTAPVV